MFFYYISDCIPLLCWPFYDHNLCLHCFKGLCQALNTDRVGINIPPPPPPPGSKCCVMAIRKEAKVAQTKQLNQLHALNMKGIENEWGLVFTQPRYSFPPTIK